jgi:hypothetical protein
LIDSRTLAPYDYANFALQGGGFSIISASGGALNHIELLRGGKVIEDLRGTFGEGFYFKAPDGGLFDGARYMSINGGTFSVYMGFGIAGILETDNSRPVVVTNSALAVDVQNAILNTEVSNSMLDVDIAAQSVTLNTRQAGAAGNAPSEGFITSIQVQTNNFATLANELVEIEINADFWNDVYSTCPSVDVVANVYRNGSTLIYSRLFATGTGSVLCASREIQPIALRDRVFDVPGASASRYYLLSFTGNTQVKGRNLSIVAKK